MKTQIITLESHDDLISVRDKLSWAKTPRILLVWPKYEKVTLRLLDLKVLQRHADSAGARLGIVTRRANVRRDAESLGIPVFESARDAQRELWPYSPPRNQHIPRAPRRDLRKLRDSVYVKEPAWRTSLAGRAVTFTVGVLAVLAVAGLFVPRAAVILYPESQVQSVVIPVSASASASSVSLTGSIPAYTASVIVSEKQSMAVNGQIVVPKSKAKGVAHFTNLSQSEVIIPAGTVVIASGENPVRFITLDETHLAAGPGEFVETPIEALVPGAQGNVDAEAISVLEGQLGLTLSVTNPEPTTGGTDSTQTGASENDRARLRKQVLENLRREAESQIRGTLETGDLLLMDTFDVSQVLDETYSPLEGQPGKQLTLTMKAQFSANYVSADDLSQLTSGALDAAVPAGFIASAAPTFEPVKNPLTDAKGITHFELKTTRTLYRQLDIPQVFALTRGLDPKIAQDKLAKIFSLRQSPDIKITPSWWPWMPLIPFNILVEMK